MPKLKIKPKYKKPASQWEIIEDDTLMMQDGGYQWSTQKQEPVKLATPNYSISKTDGRTKPLTQKEIEDFRKHTENLKLQADKQELATRKARIEQSIQAQNLPLTPQNLAIETQAIGDKLRFFPNAPSDSFKGVVDDYLNPFKMIGDMASGLGSAPYNVQQGNYGQAALSVGIPLATGTLAGIGANSTKQFANNLVNPLAGVIEKPGSLFREQVYKAIDPVAYGMKEKLKSAPKTWLKNTLAKDESQRALNVGKQLSNLNPEYFADDITRIGQNRLDAFRVGLKLPQRYDTFEKIGENTYRIKNMNPQIGEFSSVYNDLQASDYLTNSTGVYIGENPLVALTRKHDKLTSPVIKTDFGDYSVNDLRRYLLKKGDDLPPWEQHRIVEKAKNPEFTHSVYDADRQGIMGSFRWDVKKPSFENDYKIHFQSNDLWNLNPFEKRGQISVKGNEELLENWYKPLENFEALSFVGGKPFNIQNNFVVDPKTYQILQKYKSGGKIKTDPKGYWNKDNIGKPVNIPSNRITMKGVNQPLMGISNTGDMQMMYPNGEYLFDGNSVLELPLMQQGGQVRQPIPGTQQQYQAYQDSLHNYNQSKPYEGKFPIVSNEEMLRSLNLPLDYFNDGKEVPMGGYKLGNGNFRTKYPQPVQPVIYRPEVNKVEYYLDENGRKRGRYLTTDFKVDEQPIQMNRMEGNLPSIQPNLEFNPVPFKKGTYFTRPRQRQEQGSGSLTDYFDKKTGKLLGTFRNGGKINNSDWELID